MGDVVADLERCRLGEAGAPTVAPIPDEDNRLSEFLRGISAPQMTVGTRGATAATMRTVQHVAAARPGEEAGEETIVGTARSTDAHLRIEPPKATAKRLGAGKQAPWWRNKRVIVIAGAGVASLVLVIALLAAFNGGGGAPPITGNHQPHAAGSETAGNAQSAGTNSASATGKSITGSELDVRNPAAREPAAGFALDLDGKSAYAAAPNLSPQGCAQITLEAWAATRDIRNAVIVGWAGGMQVRLQSAGQFSVLASESEQHNPSINAASQAVKDELTHVAAVWDGASLSLFVNGKRQGNSKPLRALQPLKFDNFGIGCWDYGGKRTPVPQDQRRILFFNGMVDEVRVSKVARYAMDFTPKRRFEPDNDTLALYHCDEGVGDELKDVSSNQQHARLVGTKWVRDDGTLEPLLPQ